MNHGGGEWGVGSGRQVSGVGSRLNERLRCARSLPLPDTRQPYNRPMAEPDKATTKKKMDKARFRAVLKDAGEIIWRSRLRLALRIPLLLPHRLSSIVLPYLSKLLYDNVLAKGQLDLLP